MIWHPLPTCVAASGIPYHGATAGNGPSMLLLHGFAGTVQGLDPISCVLSSQFSLLGIDLPGHGRTRAIPDPNLKFDHVIADLHEVIRRWHPHPVHVTGYSMGGRVGLGLACRFPDAVKSLSLLSASPGISDVTGRQTRSVLDRDLAKFLAETPDGVFDRYWESMPLFGGDRAPGARGCRVSSKNMRQGWSASLHLLGTGVQPSFWNDLSHLDRPVQLITGERDIKFRNIADAMNVRLPKCQTHTVPHAGHRVHLENPRATARLIADWAMGHDDTHSP